MPARLVAELGLNLEGLSEDVGKISGISDSQVQFPSQFVQQFGPKVMKILGKLHQITLESDIKVRQKILLSIRELLVSDEVIIQEKFLNRQSGLLESAIARTLKFIHYLSGFDTFLEHVGEATKVAVYDAMQKLHAFFPSWAHKAY